MKMFTLYLRGRNIINPFLVLAIFIFQYNFGYSQQTEQAPTKGDVKNHQPTDDLSNPIPPGWDTYSIQGNPHGVIVMLSANPRINDIPILPGDYIGVFYLDDNSELKCGGQDIWLGDDNIIFGAFTNDPDTPEKDGFAFGEEMHFKIYSYTTLKEYDVDQLSFDLTNYTGTNIWYPLAISQTIDMVCLEDFDAYASATPNPVCFGNTVSLEANIFVGTTGNYTYSWTSDPPGFTSILQSVTVTPTENTVYFLEVSDGILFSDHSANVIVNHTATVVAGSDVLICENESAHLTSNATNYSSILWTTAGDGVFDNPEILTPFYTPGPLDAENGFATLTVQALALADCEINATDEMVVNVGKLPSVNFSETIDFCDIQEIWIDSEAEDYSSIEWSTSGDGTFSDPNETVTQYFPGDFDVNLGEFTLHCCVEALNPCSVGVCEEVFCTLTESSTVNAPSSRTKCENLPVPLISVAFNYTSVLWTTAGDGSFEDPAALSTNYIPGPLDNQNGGTVVTVNAFGHGACLNHPATKNVNVIILPVPNVDAGDTDVICSNDPLQLQASAEDYASLAWTTTGDGSFSNSGILNPLYYPGIGDFLSGGFVLTLTAQPFIPCTTEVSDILEVDIIDQSVVDINTPNNQSLCEGLSLQLDAWGSGYVGILWETTGDGYFDDPTILNPVYFHGPVSDLSGNPVTLTVTAFASPNCSPDDTDQISVTYNYGTSANAGNDFAACEDQVFVSATAENYGSTLWETNGDGYFLKPALLATQYIPGAQDLLSGNAELCLIAYGIGDCPDDIDCLTVGLTGNPSVDIGEDDDAVCFGENHQFTHATILYYSSLNWFTENGGGTFDNPNSTNPTYIPNPEVDYTLGCISIGVSAEPLSPCNIAEEDFMELCFQAPPTVQISLDEDNICYGEDYYLMLNEASEYLELVWFTEDGGGTFSDNSIIDPVYYPNPAVDYLLGCITIGVSAEPLSPCTIAAEDFMELCFQASPEVEIGEESAGVCYGESYYFASATAMHNLSIHWYTVDGGGTFDNTSLTNPTYYPDPDSDYALGCIAIGVAAEPMTPCTVAAEDFMDLCFQAPPEVDIGVEGATICYEEFYQFEAVEANNNSSILWSTSGDGNFDDPNILNPTYFPSPSFDYPLGCVQITALAQPISPCAISAEDIFELCFQASPEVEIGIADAAICHGDNFTFTTVTASNNSTVEWFTNDGGGSFNNANDLNPTYIPDPEIDYSQGCVTLGISAEPFSPCAIATEDYMELCFNAPPEATAGPDVTIIETEAYATQATVNNFSYIVWSTSGDGTFENNMQLETNYYPGEQDIQNESVQLTITAHPLNACPSPTSDVLTLIVMRQQNIPLQTGWSGFSSFVEPGDPSFDDVVSPISDQLVFAQNMIQLYWPEYGINTIGDFSNYNGYKIKLSAEANLPITGFSQKNKTVSIPEGWSIFPVLSDCFVPYTELISQLGDKLTIMTEIGGDGILWPDQGIYLLAGLEPGKAYMLKVTEDVDFTFPDCSTLKSGLTEPLGLIQLPLPYNEVYKTADKHLVCFPENALIGAGIRPRSVVATYNNENNCVGAAIWENGNIVLHAYADDITTPEIDGYVDGEPLNISVFDQSDGTLTEYSVEYSTEFDDNEGVFVVNGVSVVLSLKASATGIDQNISNSIRLFPNPANHEFSVFSDEEISWIEITSIEGNLVQSINLINQLNTAKILINVSELKPGIYFVRIKTDQGLAVKKLIVQ